MNFNANKINIKDYYNAREINLLNYSESCTGEVQDDAIIEGYQYCMSMNRAFDPLLSETYTAIHFEIRICLLI